MAQEGWIYVLDFTGTEIRRFGAHTVRCFALLCLLTRHRAQDEEVRG